jgi:transcriptional regulator with XRE-family HTH domain
MTIKPLKEDGKPMKKKTEKMAVRRRTERDIEVAQRVRIQRLSRGMAQTELADHLGVSFQQVQKYEKGTNRISAGRLEQIAEALGVQVTFFYGLTDNKKSTEEIMGFLDSANALRLLNAFSRLRDPGVQRAVVVLVEQIAEKQ